jgi:signal peptidase I
MSEFDWYIFFLCLMVFVLLAVTFTYLIALVVKMTIRLIRTGDEDESILKEFENKKKKKASSKVLDCVVSTVLCVVLLVAFVFSLVVNLQENTYFENLPTLKIVTSSSMATRYENNTYLFENNLTDQVKVYDLLFTYKAPAEEELELYDIVVYEVDGNMVLHRIIGIEEPNEYHPDKRYFLCQGDALERADRFPVRYSQIHGIYRGERIPFVGSFLLFMQSPAGWLCVLLVLFVMIATPIIEKKILAEQKKRLSALGVEEESTERVEEKARG